MEKEPMSANSDLSAGFQPGDRVRAKVPVQGLRIGEVYQVKGRFIDADKKVAYILEAVGRELLVKNLPLLAERVSEIA
jgi:hypothetical protein